MFNEWYLARDKAVSERNDNGIRVWPTSLTGVKKVQGCIHYEPTDSVFYGWEKWWEGDKGAYSNGMALTPCNCKKVFGHCPKKGELLCVKKTRNGWKATKIELSFS